MNIAAMRDIVVKFEPYAFQAKMAVEGRFDELGGEGIEQDIVPIAALGLLIGLIGLVSCQNKLLNYLKDKFLPPEERAYPNRKRDFP